MLAPLAKYGQRPGEAAERRRSSRRILDRRQDSKEWAGGCHGDCVDCVFVYVCRRGTRRGHRRRARVAGETETDEAVGAVQSDRCVLRQRGFLNKPAHKYIHASDTRISSPV